MRGPQSLIVAASVGALAGAYASIWGMHKDSIRQGFGAGRFAGSVFVGAGAAMALQSALQFTLPQPGALVLLFGLAYAGHHGLYQSWKTFLQPQGESERFIPMTFTVGGVSAARRSAWSAVGTWYALAVGLFLIGLAQLDRSASGPPTLVKTALAGLIAGMIIAARGAWKHAPTEGFQRMRFIRSPSMTIAFAIGLSYLTHSYLYLAVAAIGYERVAVETWKTLCAYIAFRLRDGPWA